MVARKVLKDALGRAPYVRYQAPTSVLYSDDIADEILERLALGEPLNLICQSSRMPSEAAVRRWAKEDVGADSETGAEGFAAKYARAREFGYYALAEELLTITDASLEGPDGWVDNGKVAQMRLLCDNRKWLLGKMMPKQFGDKVTQEITGQDGSQLVTRIELIPVEPRRLNSPETLAEGSPEEARDRQIADKRQKS